MTETAFVVGFAFGVSWMLLCAWIVRRWSER
jgi:hypothetical protein